MNDISKIYLEDFKSYLLVEKNPGPTGTQIIPDYKYTYWHVNSETTDFTVTVDGYNTREKYYSIDQINHDNIPNYVETEGEGGVVYLASVRLAKWRDFLDKENSVFTHEYEPLPGVEFELRLPGPSGTAAKGQVISYLTVGLEGNGGAAKAQSGVFRLDFMEDGIGMVKATRESTDYADPFGTGKRG